MEKEKEGAAAEAPKGDQPEPAKDVTEMPYGDLHRIVLQGMMAAGLLDSKGIRTLFEGACEFLRMSKEDAIERSAMKNVETVIRCLNAEIANYHMQIKSATCELTGKKYLLFMLTAESEILKTQHAFSTDEIEIFKKCLDGMLRTHPNFSLSHNECVNIIKAAELGNRSMRSTETFVNRMVEMQYFTKYIKPHQSEEDCDITLGIRTIREFETLLREHYNDIVRKCNFCNAMLLHGYRCPSCKVLVHKPCYSKYVKSKKTCPNCNGSWAVDSRMLRRSTINDEEAQHLDELLPKPSDHTRGLGKDSDLTLPVLGTSLQALRAARRAEEEAAAAAAAAEAPEEFPEDALHEPLLLLDSPPPLTPNPNNDSMMMMMMHEPEPQLYEYHQRQEEQEQEMLLQQLHLQLQQQHLEPEPEPEAHCSRRVGRRKGGKNIFN